MAGRASLPRMDVPEIDVAELAQKRAAGAPLIDVREPDEYEEAHVPGAHLVPLGTVPDRLAEVPTEGTVYVICAKGGRSMRAAEFYRGRTVNLIAGFNPGGGADTYARLVARHIGKHIPGSPTVVVRNNLRHERVDHALHAHPP